MGIMENEIKAPRAPRMTTIAETARDSGVPEYCVRRLVKGGKIVAIQAGKKWLINYDKFIEYLNTNIPADDKLAEDNKPCRITPIPKEM